jgi:motility quorum-sensing regulator/GCU-specific mRNA interferase toxin
MEKKTPAYDLAGFQKEFTTIRALRLTRTASTCALSLGLTLLNVVQVIQSMKREHFYKSMTADGDSRIWQDVYHAPWETLTLYVKLTIDEEGRLLVSFKEK